MCTSRPRYRSLERIVPGVWPLLCLHAGNAAIGWNHGEHLGLFVPERDGKVFFIVLL
jgi:hypothetical protein